MSQTNARAPWFGENAFEKTVALFMTLVLIQTALITYWFIYTDDAQGDAGRDAQIYALRGLGQRMLGNVQNGYAQSVAYQRWVEFNTLAKLADSDEDPQAAQRYRAARDRVAQLSPLLQAPYLSGPDSPPDIGAYEADLYIVETVTLAERFSNQYALKTFWYDKASAFATQLTLLAIALFLFGLANTTQHRMRYGLASGGAFIATIVLGWALLVQSQTTSGLPDAAIQAYARGVGWAYQSRNAEAITAFDRALQIAPEYVNAYRARAFAHEARTNYPAAIADFQRARALGDSSADVAGELAWVYYLQGDLPNAIELNRIALAVPGSEEWVEYDLALAWLAAGQTDAAQAQYTASMQAAIRQVATVRAAGKQPPATLWWSLDISANDLTNLIACLDAQPCVQTPSRQTLASPAQVRPLAVELAVRLRELSVALEYTDKPPQAPLAAKVSAFRFTQDDPGDPRAKFLSTLSDPTAPIYVMFDYTGVNPGDLIVVKVSVEGEEDLRLRVIENFSAQTFGAPNQNAGLTLSLGDVPLDSGAYRVELYVNARLAQQGAFTVQAE